jgi:hypothetical protein
MLPVGQAISFNIPPSAFLNPIGMAYHSLKESLMRIANLCRHSSVCRG